MKKIISTLLVWAIILGLCACGPSEQTDNHTKNNAIALTKENISQYLAVKVTGPEPLGTNVWYEELFVEIYPLEAGSFSNVDLMLFIDLDGYTMSLASGAQLYCKGYEGGMLSFTIASDGRYQFKINVYENGTSYSPSNIVEGYEIAAVSGTFTPIN